LARVPKSAASGATTTSARRSLLALALICTASACASPAQREYERRGFVFASGRALSSDWSPFERQLGAAVQVAIEPVDAAETEFGLELGLNMTRDEDSQVGSSEWLEFSIGATKTVELVEDSVYTNFGFGFAYLWVEQDAPQPTLGSNSDDGLGYYMHIGIFWQLTKALDVGLDLRGGDGILLRLNDTRVEADYSLLSVGVGFGF
jgi:hypothetical protein